MSGMNGNAAIINTKFKESKLVCTICGKKFAHHSNLSRHRKYVCDRKPSTDDGSLSCPTCSISFSRKESLKIHTDKSTCTINSSTKQYNKKGCFFPDCNVFFFRRVDLVKHLLKTHNFKMESEILTFSTILEFRAWKLNLGSANYPLKTTRNVEGVKVNYYSCQFDRRKNKVKKENTKAICDQTCPARIIANVKTNGIVHVEYYKSHNHKLILKKFSYYDGNVLKFVASSFNQGYSAKTTLNQLKKHVFSGEDFGPERIYTPSKKLFSETSMSALLKCFNKIDLKPRTEDDMRSVYLYAEEHLQTNLLCYQCADINEIIVGELANLNPKVFVIGLQSARLFDHIDSEPNVSPAVKEELCSVLFVDVIPIGNRHSLYNFLVIDEFGEGYPVAHIITNADAVQDLIILFQNVAVNLEEYKVNAIITDQNKVLVEALQSAFPESQCLLSIHHVLKDWKKKCTVLSKARSNPTDIEKKIQDEDRKKKKLIVSILNYFLHETDTGRFEKMYDVFIEHIEQNEPEFYEYFQANYMALETSWALCYRHSQYHNEQITSNLFKDYFNNILRSHYLSKKYGKRIDALVEVLEEIENAKFKIRIKNINDGVHTLDGKIETNQANNGSDNFDGKSFDSAINPTDYLDTGEQNFGPFLPTSADDEEKYAAINNAIEKVQNICKNNVNVKEEMLEELYNVTTEWLARAKDLVKEDLTRPSKPNTRKRSNKSFNKVFVPECSKPKTRKQLRKSYEGLGL